MMKTAFVFPGQGSQSIGMLSDFEHHAIILDTFAQASEAVGYDLWKLIQKGPEEKLNQTQYTQVAMLTADVAVYRLLMQHGLPEPCMMAGHSLGEYAALVCAQALSLDDAVCLVAHRGAVMQNAVPLGVGAMAAIVGLTDEQVLALCEQATQVNERVTPANYNAIGQIVVAGHAPAVQRALELAEQSGARLTAIIPVSVPCHCPLMAEAAEVYAEYLAKIKWNLTQIPVVNHVDVSFYQSAQHILEKLKEQLYSPVRWVETIQLIKNNGITLFVECGPGKVLSGLIKRIDRSLNTLSVYDTLSLNLEEYK